MKLSITASILLSAGLARAAVPRAVATTACNADNCARQITGTRAKTPDLAARQTDCSNFMTTTVYATPTATTTPAVVYDNANANVLGKRDAVTVTGSLPAYATDCAGAADYSSACRCWGFTATTITVTTPTTTVPAATPTCHQGLEWAYFSFTPGSPAAPGQLPPNSGDTSNYQNLFDPVVFHSQTPAAEGVTGAAGVPDFASTACDDVTPVTVYGTDTGKPIQYAGLELRGYLVPPASGDYTFTATVGDEIVVIWAGASAASGFTLANALVVEPYSHPATSGTYTVLPGDEGKAVPVRFMWANAQGCAAFTLQVTGPDGATILDGSTVQGPLFVQSCDNAPAIGAPAWPAWASE